MAESRFQRVGSPKSGAFGEVCKYIDTTLDVERAIKRVRVKDDAERQGVIREARLLVKLGSHPNIVQLYDIIEGENYVGLVMDWVEGGTLAEYLTSKGTLSKTEALLVVGEVLKALEFAHSQRILHSDIKPGNVMRGTDGSIRLVDFGVARTMGTHSMGYAMGVTYPFAPPEFFQPPHKLDLRADLWAVGVMLYQLVTARLPFMVEAAQSSNPFAWASAITPCNYAALSDSELHALLQRVLVPLEQRLATANAFHAALTLSENTVPPVPAVPQPVAKPEGGEPKRSVGTSAPLLAAYKAQMVQIPAGKFQKQIGTAPVYEERPAKGFLSSLQGKMEKVKVRDRPTYRTITLSPFQMGHTLVTVGMWQEYAKAQRGGEMPPLPPKFPVWKDGWDVVRKHPIVNVSWDDCKSYADWAELLLPSEAQWEYAASGGDGRIYPWGKGWDASKCQCSEQSVGDTRGTAAVGSYPAGPFSLYDMSGNVWEWCSDWHGDYPRRNETDPIGASSGEYRVLRGGSWVDRNVVNFRCANRYKNIPADRYVSYGFRLSSPLPAP